MSEINVIRQAPWAVVWDERRHSHIYRRDIDLVFDGPIITQITDHYDGPFDHETDARDRLIIPGLVNIHAHPGSEPLRKGITDETLSPGFHHSSLYEYLTVFDNDDEGRLAALQVALAELLLSGCTTVTDLSSPYDGWLEELLKTGIRAVVAPGFRDARWYTDDGHSLKYDWNLDNGLKAFRKAIEVMEFVEDHPSGLLSAMVYPAQIDTCCEQRLRDSYEYAVEKKLPWQIHAAQSVTEFNELHRRHGKTPIAWLDSLGVLGEQSIIGHGIFLDHHPWLHWTTNTDLTTLVERGVSVAHCPTVFARRGITLRTLGGYLKRGVNVGFGTDTYPHNFLDEMRNAMTFARVIGESVADLTTGDVFHAATIGGANALARNDIGRLAVGAKADFSLVDLQHPSMQPVREPLRSLMHVALERPIRDVFVHGKQVVADGVVKNIDLPGACQALQEAQQRSLSRTRQLDWANRSADELSPLVFPIG